MTTRAATLAFAVALVAPARADAYVRSKTSDGLVKFWAESCIPITIYLNKFTFPLQYPDAQQSIDAVVKSLTGAAHAWSPDAVSSCPQGSVSRQPYLEILPTFAPVDATPPAIANDHHNIVVFRTESWTKSGNPAAKAYDALAVAVTTVFSMQNGKIQDADIEINAANVPFTWLNIDDPAAIPRPAQINEDMFVFDLQNSITHEFGHLLGLEHTCFIPAVPGGDIAADGSGTVRPQNDKGQAVPDCKGENLSSDVTRAVMFYSTEGEDTSKRVLSPDEVRFLCDVYPAARDPQMCRADQANTGCATAPASARRGGAAARALGLAAFGGLMLVAVIRTARARRARARRVSAKARARA